MDAATRDVILLVCGVTAPVAVLTAAVAAGYGHSRRALSSRLRVRVAESRRGRDRRITPAWWLHLVDRLIPLALTLAGAPGRELERVLERAGRALTLTVDDFHRRLAGATVAGCGIGTTIGVGLRQPLLAAVLAACGAVVTARLATYACRSEMRAAQESLTGQLPTLIDVLALCARAGMSLDQSLDLYCDRFDGSLGKRLAASRTRWAIGAQTRSGEFQRLAAEIDSPVFDRFLAALRHATEMGTSLAPVLEAQAAEVRAHRQSVIEEQASKLPVKMLVPIGVFTLPAMLILLLTPVLVQVGQGLALGGG